MNGKEYSCPVCVCIPFCGVAAEELAGCGQFRCMLLPQEEGGAIQQPIRLITVEREYGSRGGEFAHDLATRLGWRLLDSELVAGAARTAGVPEKTASKYDDQLDPWYYRYGKVFWQESLYSS